MKSLMIRRTGFISHGSTMLSKSAIRVLTNPGRGRRAYFHLHLWRPHLRKAGLGTEFSRRSVQFYFERFRLKRLFSEPFAENLAPNKVLPRLGFKFIQRYRTVPGAINGEQEVNRYMLAGSEGAGNFGASECLKDW